MSNIEVITSANCGRLEELTLPLAEIYKIAFAGVPWREVSRCPNESCETGFCKEEVGGECLACASTLVSAYDVEELGAVWQAMVENDDAMIEIEVEGGVPIRATIARPTTPEELYDRKYANTPVMRNWLLQQLPADLVWIEDTFADRSRRKRGNLKQRGATLGRIAANYGGLLIYTRTIAPQIVDATLRDITDTRVFVGTKNVEEIAAAVRKRRPELDNRRVVPDERTIMAINALRGQT